jgi:hypothetical protein
MKNTWFEKTTNKVLKQELEVLKLRPSRDNPEPAVTVFLSSSCYRFTVHRARRRSNSPPLLHPHQIHLAADMATPLCFVWATSQHPTPPELSVSSFLVLAARHRRRGHLLRGWTSSVGFVSMKLMFELPCTSVFISNLVLYTDQLRTSRNTVATVGARRCLRCQRRLTVLALPLPHPLVQYG